MRVRAIAPGFYDINNDRHPIDIQVGAEFNIPDDAKLGKWMEKVDTKAPHPAEIKPPPSGGNGPKAKSVI